jgi:hypothetical protein
VAAPGAVIRGLIQWIYSCRLVRLPLSTYLRRAFLPAALTAGPPAVLLAFLVRQHSPSSWTQLFVFGACYAACFGASAYLVLIRGKLSSIALRPIPGNASEAASEEAPIAVREESATVSGSVAS